MRPLPFVACCVLSVAAASTLPSLALAQATPAAPAASTPVPESDLVAPEVEPRPVRPWSG